MCENRMVEGWRPTALSTFEPSTGLASITFGLAAAEAVLTFG
jgi:hypothetical protein